MPKPRPRPRPLQRGALALLLLALAPGCIHVSRHHGPGPRYRPPQPCERDVIHTGFHVAAAFFHVAAALSDD